MSEVEKKLDGLVYEVAGLEMEFFNLSRNDYADVVKHSTKIVNLFEREFEDSICIDPEEYQDLIFNHDIAVGCVEDARETLDRLKEFVKGLRATENNGIIFEYVEELERDLSRL